MTEPLTAGVPAPTARVLCVVVHGRYGSPETMMEHLVCRLTAPGVHFVLPRAAGGMWYAAPTAAPLTPATEAEVAAAIGQVERDRAAAVAAGAPAERWVLAGFSQGACIALEYAFARGPWPGALCSLTGCRVGVAETRAAGLPLDGLPVYLTDGHADPFIPIGQFAATLLDLAHAGARVRAEVFPARGHEMSDPEVATLDALLRAVAAGAAPYLPPLT
jgi:phospholipase/carboxylesterase